MRCIVTGGAGFIGSHLVDRLLVDGHQVVVLDNLSTGREENLPKEYWKLPDLEFSKQDVASTPCSLDYKDVDWVFHLAGLADIVPSIEKPLDYFRANVTGTVNVLEASRLAGVKRFVYAASSSCYGIPTEYPTPEEATINPQYPYALTKYLGEQCIMHWNRVYGLPTISLRLFNVYGPRRRATGAYGAVMGVFLKQKLEGQPFTVVGDGNQKRDFIYVSDVVDAFVKAVESNMSGEILNIGSMNPQSINYLVELLGGSVVYTPERPGEPKMTHASNLNAYCKLGWEPRVSFEEGIKVTLEHIEDLRDAPLWTPEKIDKATSEWFRRLR